MTRFTDLVRRLAMVLPAVAAVLLSSACGGDRATTPTPAARELASVKACELLTAAEIEAATGIAPGGSEDLFRADRHPPHCQWRPAADASAGPIADLMVVQALRYSSYEEFIKTSREQMAEMELEFDEADWQHVPELVGGVGVWLPELGYLQVYRDGWMVQVDTQTAEGKGKLEASKDLALKALERLRS